MWSAYNVLHTLYVCSLWRLCISLGKGTSHLSTTSVRKHLILHLIAQWEQHSNETSQVLASSFLLLHISQQNSLAASAATFETSSGRAGGLTWSCRLRIDHAKWEGGSWDPIAEG